MLRPVDKSARSGRGGSARGRGGTRRRKPAETDTFCPGCDFQQPPGFASQPNGTSQACLRLLQWHVPSPAVRVAGRSEGTLLWSRDARPPDQWFALLEGFPGSLRARRQETLRGRRYSMPVPAGGTMGSICARMCASEFRSQPRNGPGVIAGSAAGFDDGQALQQPTGGAFVLAEGLCLRLSFPWRQLPLRERNAPCEHSDGPFHPATARHHG